jgi:cytochrome c oxidase subunit 2
VTIFTTQAAAPTNSLLIKVIGHQFWWEFQYPEFNLTTANEVHQPIGRTANFELTSADVIHSFWIPALGGKRDVVPGRTNYLWWTPDPNTSGVYLGQCAELCGYSHANMRMRGIVQTPEDFAAWVRQQQAPAATPPANTPAAQGAQLFTQKGCAGCHTINGTSAAGKTAPDLTHFGSRLTVAAGIMDNNTANVKRWLADPPTVKPGSLMPNLGLNGAELDALAAYLEFLK